MNRKITIELPDSILLNAEKRSREEGFDSLSSYVNALIRDDLQMVDQAWLRERISEGLASEDVGLLTDAKIDGLVAEGIARANSKA